MYKKYTMNHYNQVPIITNNTDEPGWAWWFLDIALSRLPCFSSHYTIIRSQKLASTLNDHSKNLKRRVVVLEGEQRKAAAEALQARRDKNMEVAKQRMRLYLFHKARVQKFDSLRTNIEILKSTLSDALATSDVAASLVASENILGELVEKLNANNIHDIMSNIQDHTDDIGDAMTEMANPNMFMVDEDTLLEELEEIVSASVVSPIYNANETVILHANFPSVPTTKPIRIQEENEIKNLVAEFQ